MRLAIPILSLLLSAPATAPDDLPKCPQKHPGQQNRVEDALKKGDAAISKKVAKHTVKYAIERFALQGLFDDDAYAKAKSETYEFLKWKLGNPSAICAQWVSAGYKHFDKAYSDEGAAALLGFGLPGEKGGHSEFYLPPKFVDLLAQLVKAHGSAQVAQALEQQYGIPSFITKPVLDRLVDEAAKILKRVGINIPKDYDFPNGLIRAAADAKRNPSSFLKKIEDGIKNPTTAGKAVDVPSKTAGGAPPKAGGAPPTKAGAGGKK
jgi:hypothetical protein